MKLETGTAGGTISHSAWLSLTHLWVQIIERLLLSLLVVWLGFSAQLAVAQTDGGVTFSNMGGTSRTGTVDSSGTYYSSIVGTVVASQADDEVVFVGLYEGSTLLTSTSYQVDLARTGVPINNPRNFALGANLPPGTHNLYVHAITYNDFEGNSLTYPFTISGATVVDGATFVSQSAIPTSMVVGQSYPVALTFKNSGSTTWLAGGAHPYLLGTQSPENNTNFGLNRVGIGSDVGLNGQRTFSFNVTPTQTGKLTFQWRMLSEGATWFGDFSPPVTVDVFASPPPVPTFTQPTSNISVAASGATATVAFAGSATASGGATMSKLELIEAGVVFGTGTSSVSASKALSVGMHIIELKATDSKGTNASTTRTVTVTGAGPTALITSPSNGASFNLTTGTSVNVPISATASSSGATINVMRLYIDGVINQSAGGGALNVSVGLAAGTHTLAVDATDSNGATSPQSSISVSVVGSSPTATISAPADGAVAIAANGAPASVSVTGTAVAVGGSPITLIDLLADDVVVTSTSSTTLTASVTLWPGVHKLTLRATNSAGKQGVSQPVTVTVKNATQGLDATFIGQSVPSTMRAGQPYTISVQMLNSGTTTWTPTGTNPVRLGTQNPQDNRTWNATGRAFLTGSVATGQTATFSIPVTAPATPSTYNMQWQMVAESLNWFGEKTPTLPVSVSAGAGPTATLSATPTNVRVTGSQTAVINFTAGSAASAGTTLSKLELFKGTYTADFSNTTPVASTTLSSTSATWSPTVSVPAGAYLFKVRSTDNLGISTDSKPVVVNVTNSALLGTTSGVRTNAAGNLELFGWTCKPSVSTGLNYKVLLDAPSPDAGGFQLTTGVANVATEPDNAAIQSSCSTPGAGHHFVVDLTPYLAQYAGRSLFVWAETADHSQSISLPCPDNGCTMPGTLRVALTTPQNGDKVSYPNPVFIRMQTTGGSTFDEVGFYVNGKWYPAQGDGAAGAYSASVNGLAVSATPYTVYAKARQGNTSVLSVQNQFSVVAGLTINLSSPSNGASITVGTAQSLSATTSSTAQAVKFFANGNQIATGVSSGNTWTASWTPTTAGSVSMTAVAYDSAGAQIAQSAAVNVTIAADPSNGATPIAVAVTPPHLANAEAGTLLGQVSVGNDGAAAYGIELAVPPGTAGMQPKLSLNYSSNGANGLVGLGWSLGGLSTIHRCAKTLAQDGVVGRIGFNTSDRLCLDGMRLFRSDGTNPGSTPAAQDANYWVVGAQYRTEVEGFAQITRLANGFKVEHKDGRIQYFGQNADASDTSSAIPAQGRTNETLLWALGRTEDRSGNHITIQYSTDTSTGEYVPTQIRYGGFSDTADLAVRFVYETRPDPQIQYMGGSRNDLRRRLTNVQTFINTAADGTGGSRIRNYIIRYITSANSGRSLVESVQVCAATDSECLPKTNMSWGSNPMKLTLKDSWKEYVTGDGETFPYKIVSGNFIGDGTSIFLYPQQGASSCPSCPGEAGQVHPFTGQLTGRAYSTKVTLPTSSDKFTEVLAGDLDGDGRDDLIFVDISTRHWAYCLAQPPAGYTLNFSACQLSAISLPARRNYEPNTGDVPHLVSLRNDGKMQLVAFDSSNNMQACGYASGTISCSTYPTSMPVGNPVFDGVPIDLSKQGMTDFYSVWTIRDTTSSGVTVCNFYGNTLTCKNINTGTTFAGSNPADLNADGLTDFLYTTINYNQATNTSTFTSRACLSKETDVDCNSISFTNAGGPSQLIPTVGDFTGNGVAYFVGPSPANASAPALCHIVGANTVCIPIDKSAIPDVLATFGYPQNDSTGTLYLDGSGIPAFRACTIPYYDTSRSGYTQGCITYSAQLPANEDKLVAVVNGVGQREEVDYARGDDNAVYSRYATVNGAEQRPTYPQLSTAPGVMTKQVRRNNGQGGWISNNYRYAGAMRDGLGRGSLGFTKLSITNANGVTTETTFAQNFPFIGMTTRLMRTSGACVLEDTANTLERQAFNLGAGGQSFFVDVKQIDTTLRDLDCSDLGKVQIVNQYTDGWGNLNTQTITTTANSETFVKKTVSVFNTAAGKNFLSALPTSIAITRINSKYEQATRTVTYTYNSTTGLVDTETVEPSNTTGLKLLTTYGRRNVYGLVNSTIQSWTNPACADPSWPTALEGTNCESAKQRTLSDIDYDAKGRFPVEIQNALRHTELRSYDPGSGVLIKRTDTNNLVTTWTLNGFGRATVERGPEGNETRSYVKACAGDCPNGATIAQVTDRFNGSARIATPRVAYVDSAGHPVRTLEWAFDGTKILTDQRYDALGRLQETDWARFDNATAVLASRLAYDDLNRITSTTSYDEAGAARSATTQYNGLKTVLTNAKSQVRTEWRDAIGQLRQVDDSNSPIGTTKFEYDAFGNLSKTTDPSGNVITVKYDLLGRKTDLTDPDLGWIHYDLDPVGQVWAQTTPNLRAKGKKTYMSYDRLGRMTARYETDLESHWVYDTATKGLGLLAEAYTKTNGQKDYSRTETYDSFARPRLTTLLLSDGTYTSQIDYDAWGRVISNTYVRIDTNKVKGPTKLFGSRYNAYGYLERIERGSLILWKIMAQDAIMRPTKVVFGNGLTQTRSYYPQTGRLQNATLATGTNVERLREGYNYDPLGNVMQRTQYWDVGGFTEDFTYDSLNRLKTSQVAGLPQQVFSYDATGNITSKTGAGTYTYPTQGTAATRPHAVQTVSTIAGTFVYDADGNFTSVGGTTADWTGFDMPKKITKAGQWASFIYGPEHQRARQDRSDGGKVVYAGAQEVETSASNVVTVKTYWPKGIGVEIDRGAAATELSWVHVDRLGSVVALTNETGAIRTGGKLEYDVWGKRRSTADHFSTPDSLDGTIDNRGFTGHEMLDQIDLIHMNGRVYNPQLGNFLSGDAIVKDLTNGQNFNRYSYVSNNPTNFVDPTGFFQLGSVCGMGRECTSIPINPDPSSSQNNVGILIGDESTSSVGNAAQRGVSGPSNLLNHKVKDGRLDDYARKSYEQIADAGAANDGTPVVRIEDSWARVPRIYPTSDQLMGQWIRFDALGAIFREFGASESTASYAGMALGMIGNPKRIFLSVADRLAARGAAKASAYSVAYEMELSAKSYPGLSRGKHFQEANESLLSTIEADPSFANTMRQLGVNIERTSTGLAPREPPTGWTWHHETQDGVMRLVPREQHTPGSIFWNVLHPEGYGGYAKWGK